MPVSIGVQWGTELEAKACRRGNLHLTFCSSCGFIWNSCFDPDLLEYSQRYDNSLDFSPVFQDYATELAKRLIETYEIRDKDVVELGCGKGHFLNLICEQGTNRGVGFDPSYEGERVQSKASDRITYVQDFYGEKYTGHRGDLVCCRHVFEHIQDPNGFLSTVRQTIGDQESTVAYFEVPNVRFILEKLSIWDVIYEHCNYFSHEALGSVFRRCGFEVIRLEDAYGGQFLSLEARLSDEPNAQEDYRNDVSGLAIAVKQFEEQVQRSSKKWQTRLDDLRQQEQRVVIWGGGAKSVSFLNMLKVEDAIPYVIDINPHKQGLHIPGTGQKIVAPLFLKEFQPQIVILMNPIYRGEIETQLAEMGVAAELIDA